ncbi:MAG: heavy metal sensor histidine kinase [Pseudomonadales bacterium]
MRLRDGLSATRSIVFRISLLFALLTAAVLTAMGVMIRVAVDRHFTQMDEMQMAGKLELIQQTLAEVHPHSDEQKIKRELDRALIGHHDLLVRIDTPDDQLWYQSGHAVIPQHQRNARTWETDGTPYRGISATSAAGYKMTVGIDISHHQQFLRSFERELLAIGLGGLSAMAVLGVLIARRGLAPLQTMTELVTHSSAQQLDHRLQPDDMPVELRALATAFNDLLNRIGDSLMRLSEFSADLAHELRTPINNLMIQTQVSLTKERSAADYKEILYTNYEEYERLARMISDMLFLAKADHGLIIPSRASIALGKDIRALCDFYGVLADEKNIQLCVTGEATCMGDALMLRRAFGNLLSNAIQHATAHSSIHIVIHTEACAVHVAISNQGETISPEHLPRLFNRFYRADAVRSSPSDGMGLGLAITQSIIAAHKGKISVESSTGNTTFTVVLPVVI